MRLVAAIFVLIVGAATASLASTGADDRRATEAAFSAEVRRGFNAAAYATRESAHVETWVTNLESVLLVGEQNHTNSGAFVLGAHFGLSYRIAEFARCDQTHSPEQVRTLTIQGTLARLKSEAKKNVLRVTDAELVHVLHIPIPSFAAWKDSAVTSDHDTTVIDSRRWLSI